MRTIEYRSTHVPAFLTKLWKLVADPNSNKLISWSLNGTSFIIYDEIRFAKELLPMYFKHNNMASFVRQLNMYGFRKLSCIEQGGMHSDKHIIEFYHQYFIRDQESMLELIKRKIPANRSSEDSKIKPEYVKDLINSIKNLQGKQQTAEDGMKNLRRENKVLWRQLTHMNTRYMKQQAMLQQVLPLFMNMIQTNHRLAIKRRAPLMIHEGENEPKVPRIDPHYIVEHEDSNLEANLLTPSPGNLTNRGPVIHDVTEMESNKMFAESNLICSPTSNNTKENEIIVDSPLSSLGSSEHTMDGSYADTNSMEPLNMLNCTFESRIGVLSPPSTMSSPVNIPPELPINNMGMSPEGSIVNVPFMPSALGSVPVMTPSPVDMDAATSFASQLPQDCSDKVMSAIEYLNETSNQGCAMPTTNLSKEIQAINTVLSWMPDATCENDQNIDNWLGQVFTADNLIAGASLPACGQNA